MRSLVVMLLFLAPASTGMVPVTLLFALSGLGLFVSYLVRRRNNPGRGINHALWRLNI